jgi:hypothetical protein
MDVEEIRNIVADMLVKTGHGNQDFIDSVRGGGQDDGPFMRAAMAVRNAFVRALQPAVDEHELDG